MSSYLHANNTPRCVSVSCDVTSGQIFFFDLFPTVQYYVEVRCSRGLHFIPVDILNEYSELVLLPI
jgi:hypothetical protein